MASISTDCEKKMLSSSVEWQGKYFELFFFFLPFSLSIFLFQINSDKQFLTNQKNDFNYKQQILLISLVQMHSISILEDNENGTNNMRIIE